MPTAGRVAAVDLARAYLGVQAVAGAVWWVTVVASDEVARWTLGTWDPEALAGPDLVLFVGASAVAAIATSRIAAAIASAWTVLVTVALGIHGLVEQVAGWGVLLMSAATVGTLAAASTMWFGGLPTRWFFVGPFSFRVADEGPSQRHLRRSLAQLVVFWTTFFVVVPLVLSAVEERLRLHWTALDEPAVRIVGAAMFVVGSALGLWSCVTMALQGEGTPLPSETARELVVGGPYRIVRNPMALAGVLQTSGVGLVVGSWLVIVVALAGALVWNALIRPTEEADLAARFGEPYRRYADRVACWVPRPPSEIVRR